MSADEAVATKFITEFLGRGDAAAADATLHPHVQAITGLKPTGPIDGIDAYKTTIAAFVDAIPAERPPAWSMVASSRTSCPRPVWNSRC